MYPLDLEPPYTMLLESILSIPSRWVIYIAIPTPATDVAFVLPGEEESVSNITALPLESNQDTAKESVQESLPSPIAPIVPLLIVPVNAAENNTVATSENDSEAATAPFIPGPPVVSPASLKDALEPTVTGEPSEAVVDAVVEEPTVSKAENIEPVVIAGEEVPPAAPESDPTDAVVSAIVEESAHSPETIVDKPTVTTATDDILPSEPIAKTSECVAEVKGDKAAAPEPIAVIEEATAPAEEQVPEPSAIIEEAEVDPVSDAPLSTVVDTVADAKDEQEEASKPEEPIIDEASVIVPSVSEETIKDADVSVHNVPEPVPQVPVPTSAPAEVPQVSSQEEVPEPAILDSTFVAFPEVSSPEQVAAPVVVEREPSKVGEVATETPTQVNPVEEQSKVLAEEYKAPVQPETADVPQTPPNGLDAESKTNISTTNGHPIAVTPTGATSKAFPSATESPAIPADNSPSSSKVNTMRKKRTSILGKLKHIFQHDKDKDKK
ncbi:hypothetical protein HYPSUDRAFT_477899 [Hypholoma sublateritium FD-334 SS-4]|uniref:Uncharacterized protein n=1 Tax=Hypholoma sublateritium (strain FD-334 SS-4) TaxID=945553 RepID=A0A0D2P122_HYPSF|nr:hypothetical protein HYPSUDRAFT_477899 [Hypholoma sublateritium FD-334 SS-4]